MVNNYNNLLPRKVNNYNNLLHQYHVLLQQATPCQTANPELLSTLSGISTNPFTLSIAICRKTSAP